MWRPHLPSILPGGHSSPAPQPRWEQSKEEPGELLDLPMAWGHSVPWSLSLHTAKASLRSGPPAFLWIRHLTMEINSSQIPASITARSDTSRVVPAHQLHPRSTPSLGKAWSRGKQGHRAGFLAHTAAGLGKSGSTDSFKCSLTTYSGVWQQSTSTKLILQVIKTI